MASRAGALRRGAARLALVLGSTAVSLAAAEGVYRVRSSAEPAPPDDPAWRAAIRAMNRTIYRRADDPALVYEPNPGASVPMSYGDAGFNAAGMRDDREHAREQREPDGACAWRSWATRSCGARRWPCATACRARWSGRWAARRRRRCWRSA